MWKDHDWDDSLQKDMVGRKSSHLWNDLKQSGLVMDFLRERGRKLQGYSPPPTLDRSHVMEEHLVDYATFPTQAQFYMPNWDLCYMIIAAVLLYMPYIVILPCSSLASVQQNSRNITLKTRIKSL